MQRLPRLRLDERGDRVGLARHHLPPALHLIIARRLVFLGARCSQLRQRGSVGSLLGSRQLAGAPRGNIAGRNVATSGCLGLGALTAVARAALDSGAVCEASSSQQQPAAAAAVALALELLAAWPMKLAGSVLGAQNPAAAVAPEGIDHIPRDQRPTWLICLRTRHPTLSALLLEELLLELVGTQHRVHLLASE
jgi:hypothetical protein